MRLTKIVCTLGPATIGSRETLLSAMKAGMNIARINFSHGTQEGHRKTIQMVKEISETENIPMAILLDTKGPEIRTGDVEKPVEVKAGDEVVFSYEDVPHESMPLIKVNYPLFYKDAQTSDFIILDNGTMLFDLVSVRDDNAVIAKARDTGAISSRRHVNLPGGEVSLPSMTDKDWSDLDLGIEENMDFVALSFIRTGKEVEEVTEYLKKKNSKMKVITKVETRQAVDDIDHIIAASDGIMVARGDLGAEMPFEKIPEAQDMMVQKCIAAGKPVIVATQMLESMIQNPMPTRAEVTDVFYAAKTRTDSTMLSAESAAGKHPVLAIQTMAKILEETEKHLSAMKAPSDSPYGEKSERAKEAMKLAHKNKASAIVVVTKTGQSALALSALRGMLPIIALCESAEVQRSLMMSNAIFPHESEEKSTSNAAIFAKKQGFDGTVIVMTDDAITVEKI